MTQPSEQHLRETQTSVSGQRGILWMLEPFWVLPSEGAGISIRIIINCCDSSNAIRPLSQDVLCKSGSTGRLIHSSAMTEFYGPLLHPVPLNTLRKVSTVCISFHFQSASFDVLWPWKWKGEMMTTEPLPLWGSSTLTSSPNHIENPTWCLHRYSDVLGHWFRGAEAAMVDSVRPPLGWNAWLLFQHAQAVVGSGFLRMPQWSLNNSPSTLTRSHGGLALTLRTLAHSLLQHLQMVDPITCQFITNSLVIMNRLSGIVQVTAKKNVLYLPGFFLQEGKNILLNVTCLCFHVLGWGLRHLICCLQSVEAFSLETHRLTNSQTASRKVSVIGPILSNLK